MPNPFQIALSNALKEKYNHAIMALIEFGEVPCRMYFVSTATIDCTQCQQVNNGRSHNPYAPNVPMSKNCVLCGGAGKIPQEVTKDVNLVVLFDQSKFIDAGGNIKFADDMAQTVSTLGPHTDILKCQYIIFDTNIEAFKNDHYQRYGRPQALGLGQNNFLITNWKKIS